MIIDAGKYKAIALSHQVTETSNGKAHVAVEFKISQGEMAGEVVRWRGWLHTEATEKRTMQALRAMGWVGDEIMDLGNLDNEVEIQVEHNEYEGKTTAQVAFVNTPPKRLDAAKAAELSARIKAKLAAAKPPANPFAD